MINKRVFPSTNTDTLNAPSQSPPPRSYTPIDCDFTDELEHVAVLKIEVKIEYWNSEATLSETVGLIQNIETIAKEEYLTVSTGVRIRLDHLFRLRIV